MAETLKTIASSTTKLRGLLTESKKDIHRIQLLLDSLEDALKSLWPPQDGITAGDGVAHIGSANKAPSRSIPRDRESPVASQENGSSEEAVDSKYVALQLASNASLWKETVTLVASSRIVSTAAQADEALALAGSSNENIRKRAWFADGKLYSRWIGRGAVWMVASRSQKAKLSPIQSMETVEAALVGQGMSIGYRDELVEEVTKLMVFEGENLMSKYLALITALKTWEQRHFLASLLHCFARLLNQTNPTASPALSHRTSSVSETSLRNNQASAIPAIAAFLKRLAEELPGFRSQLVEVVAGNPQNVPLSRAIIAALPNSARAEVMEKTWSNFSDLLRIRNIAVLQQDANARILLITAGYVFREEPNKVLMLARSSMHGNAISERLKNSSERISWLGMCVGMAISGLVDEEGKRMDFGVDEMQTAEAKTIRSLVFIDDEPGDMFELQRLFGTKRGATKDGLQINGSNPSTITKSKTSRSSQQTAKIIEIVEESEEGEDDDELKPYEKPDLDEPDSDDDATLVNRNKPKAPVYIRDLVSGLSDTEDEARHTLALRTAASLIRRKATFGKELHDRIPELGLCLVSVQDHFDIEEFHELKQAALVALVVAEPDIVGPWMVKTLFEGDLSISQRVSVVVAIGVGGRELAGFKENSNALKARDQEERPAWPSKMLPGKLHDLYSNNSSLGNLLAPSRDVNNALKGQERDLRMQSQKIEGLSRQMESTMLNPVSTREWSKPRTRTRLFKNDLTNTVANSFFFPLTRYWQVYSQSSPTQVKNPLEEPLLTALTLKTLTLLLLAAGPSAPSLPQTTKEMFALLLSLRSKASRHQPVLEGILFALVALLDLHGVGVEEGLSMTGSAAAGARWLAEECGKEIVELREWVGGVWESIEHTGAVQLKLGEPGPKEKHGGDADTERCRVLAAKILVGIHEAIEKYQRLLVGELSRV